MGGAGHPGRGVTSPAGVLHVLGNGVGLEVNVRFKDDKAQGAALRVGAQEVG